jgi:hypothetical protein
VDATVVAIVIANKQVAWMRVTVVRRRAPGSVAIDVIASPR